MARKRTLQFYRKSIFPHASTSICIWVGYRVVIIVFVVEKLKRRFFLWQTSREESNRLDICTMCALRAGEWESEYAQTYLFLHSPLHVYLFLHCSSVCLLIWYVCLSPSFYVCKWLCVPYVCEYFTCLSPSFHDSVSLLVCLSVCLSLSLSLISS